MCGGYLLYILLYVDDMLVIEKVIFEVKKEKGILNGGFEIKDLGSKKESSVLKSLGIDQNNVCAYPKKCTLR